MMTIIMPVLDGMRLRVAEENFNWSRFADDLVNLKYFFVRTNKLALNITMMDTEIYGVNVLWISSK